MPRRAALLRLHYFAFYAAIGAYLPFFPTWLEAHGIRGLSMSTLTALWPLLGMVSPLLFGLAADRFGLRGSLVRIAAIGAFVPFALLTALELSGESPSYPVLFGLMLVFAFFRAPLVTIADVTALEDPGSYGKMRLFGSLGFMLMAGAAGAFLTGGGTFALPLTMSAALLLVVGVAFALPTHGAKPMASVLDGAMKLLKSPDYAWFLVAGFLWYASHVAYDICFSLHLRDLGASPRAIGLCWAVGVLAEILLMANTDRFLAAFSPWKLLTFGLVVTAARFAVVGQLDSLPVLFLLQPLHAITFALVWVTALDIVRRRAPAGLLGTAQGLFSVSTAVGSATGMLAWGPLYAEGGGSAVFGGAALVAALGAVATWLPSRLREAALLEEEPRSS